MKRLPFFIALLLFGCSTASYAELTEPKLIDADAALQGDAALNVRSTVNGSDGIKILDATGVQGGLIVHLGCGDARLTASLYDNERYLVHGLDTDADQVDAAREHIRELGLYGPVSINLFGGQRLPYADNFVNLIVAENLGDVTMDEVMRVLTPLGVAFIAGETIVKPWPDEIDEWTHWLHSADGNAVAQDTVVGPPRRMQWIAGPEWSRHHNTAPSTSASVSAGGRIFYIADEAPPGMSGAVPDKWSLVARDAFNGLPLWKILMPEWGWEAWSTDWRCRFTVPTHIPCRLVAIGDRVYVTLAFNAPLTELDAATGEIVRVFEGSEWTDEILYHDGQLILSVNQGPQHPGIAENERRGLEGEPIVKKSVAVIDVETGEMLWKKGDYVGLRSKTGSMERISHLSMCAGDGHVFFVDGDRIIGLDLETGDEAWNVERPEVPENKMRYDIRITDMCTLVYNDGHVFFAQLNPDRRIDWREIQGRLHAFSAETGEELWDHECASWGWGHPADVFIVDGLVWIHDYQSGPRTGSQGRAFSTDGEPSRSERVVGLDPATGEIRRTLSNFEAFDNGHHHRCYRNKATTQYMMTSYRGFELIPFDGKDTSLNHWVRGACRLGGMPCNGLIYANPHPCECYIGSKLNGYMALAPAGSPTTQASAAQEASSARLERGPAYRDVGDLSTGIVDSANTDDSDDWPTYRHDSERRATTQSPMSAQLREVWTIDLGTRSSACTTVDDTVLVSAVDKHQVTALDASNGSIRWTYFAGGRVDTPPTISDGRAYFGSADGCVYCVRISDGQLVWRFRAALEQRMVGAYDGVESAWPVHGSVLVREGVVYFTTGRSSFLDGGIFAFALDAQSGEIISQQDLATPHDIEVGIGHGGYENTGMLADLLVAHEDAIYMRQHRMFSDEDFDAVAAMNEGADIKGRITLQGCIGVNQPEPSGGPLHSTGGMLDESWFNRTGWYLDGRAVSEYCVFDSETIYGVAARGNRGRDSGFITPGVQGYEIFASDRSGKKQWAQRISVRVTSMACAGSTLFAAGTPDVIDPNDTWAVYEGKRGGRLLVISVEDGELLAEHELASAPVLDGLTIARGRLFISTIDGKIQCFNGDNL